MRTLKTVNRSRVLLLVSIGIIYFPSLVRAHGLHTSEPIDFSLPFNLYVLGSVIAVAISFLLVGIFSRTDVYEPQTREVNLLTISWLHSLYRSRILRVLVQIVSVLFFLLLVIAGIFGTQSSENITPVGTWVIFGVGLTFFTMLIGDVWSFIHPVGNILLWLKLPRHTVPYPTTWQVYPALLQFFVYRWIENIFKFGEEPWAIAIIILLYTAVTVWGMLHCGRDVWFKHGDPFGVFFRLIASVSLLVFGKGKLIFRTPGRTLTRLSHLNFSETLFVLLMLASIAFDSLKASDFFARRLAFLETLSIPPMPRLTFGFLILILFFVATYFLCCVFVELFSGRTKREPIPWREFAMTFIPIAVGYELAHYLRFLLVEGQRIIPLLSDPLGYSWNLFGTAFYTINESIIAPEVYWRLQVGFIVLGHILAVIAAHSVAVHLYGNNRMALLSQVPMIILMLGYTVFSLWILQAA